MSANYILIFSKKFLKLLGKMSELERQLVLDKISIFEDDPFYPSLRSKKLNGSSGYYESSINMDIRIVWKYNNGRVIILIDVGRHDILDKY